MLRPRPGIAQLADFHTTLVSPGRPGPQASGKLARSAPPPLMPGAWHLGLPARSGQRFLTAALLTPLPHFSGSGWAGQVPAVLLDAALPVAIADASWPAQARARRGLSVSIPRLPEMLPVDRPAVALAKPTALDRRPAPLLPRMRRPMTRLAAPRGLRSRQVPHTGEPRDRPAQPRGPEIWFPSPPRWPFYTPARLDLRDPALLARPVFRSAPPPQAGPPIDSLSGARLEIPAPVTAAPAPFHPVLGARPAACLGMTLAGSLPESPVASGPVLLSPSLDCAFALRGLAPAMPIVPASPRDARLAAEPAFRPIGVTLALSLGAAWLRPGPHPAMPGVPAPANLYLAPDAAGIQVPAGLTVPVPFGRGWSGSIPSLARHATPVRPAGAGTDPAGPRPSITGFQPLRTGIEPPAAAAPHQGEGVSARVLPPARRPVVPLPAAPRPVNAQATASLPPPQMHTPRATLDALAGRPPTPDPVPVTRSPVNLSDRAIRVSDLAPSPMAGVVPLELPWRHTRRTWMRAARWRPLRERFFLELPALQPPGLRDAVRQDWRDRKPLDYLKIGWKSWIGGKKK